MKISESHVLENKRSDLKNDLTEPEVKLMPGPNRCS